MSASWLSALLRLAFPAAAPAAPAPSIAVDVVAAVRALAGVPFSQIAANPLATVEDVLGALAAVGVPWAGTVEDLIVLLQIGATLAEANGVTGGTVPELNKHDGKMK